MHTAAVPSDPSGPLARAWGDRASAGSLEQTLADAPERLRNSITRRPASTWVAEDAALAGTLDRDKPWPEARASDFARYFRDGNRTAYEDNVRRRHARLSLAVVNAMAAGADEIEAWLDEVTDGVVLFCEQSTWCWAAHDDTHDRHGFVLPHPEHPFVDLGAGEVAGQLAWIDIALGDALDARSLGLRERIRAEVARRVFEPFVSRRDWHWLGLDGDVHNWNPWIHGNVVVAACALADHPADRARIVASAIEGIDRYFASLPEDGAIDEGYAYWWNGAGRALEALEVLGLASAGRLDGAAVDVARALVRFPASMHIDGPWYVNVADAPAKLGDGAPWRTLHHWGEALGDSTASAHAKAQWSAAQAQREEPSVWALAGLGRILLAGNDAAWVEARAGDVDAPTPESTWLPSVQLMVARSGPEAPARFIVAAKGGHNGEHHNHKDVASFTVAVDGVPVVVDAGQPTYTSQTFGPDRYAIRTMQSGWHSAPAPWGLEQGLGPEAASVAAHRDDGVRARARFEAGAAWPLPSPSRWTRSVTLDRGELRVEVGDAWDLARPATPDFDGVLLHYLLHGDVEVAGGVVRVVSAGAVPVRLAWSGADVHLSTERWELDDPLLESVWGTHLTRLTAAIPAPGSGPFAASVTLVVTLES